jgi:hypothetical protein
LKNLRSRHDVSRPDRRMTMQKMRARSAGAGRAMLLRPRREHAGNYYGRGGSTVAAQQPGNGAGIVSAGIGFAERLCPSSGAGNFREWRADRRSSGQQQSLSRRAPGTCRFTVQSYGFPTSRATTVQLAAGARIYLQVQWAASWQFGCPEAARGFAHNTFIITPNVAAGSAGISPDPGLSRTALSRIRDSGSSSW